MTITNTMMIRFIIARTITMIMMMMMMMMMMMIPKHIVKTQPKSPTML